MDIYDIPIAQILDQYNEYIHMMELLDIDIAGEFLVMAATLMLIKSKMLLPVESQEEEEEDPRMDLVNQLLEYQRFKQVASLLEDKAEAQADFFLAEEMIKRRWGLKK